MIFTNPLTGELESVSYNRLSQLQYWLRFELSSTVLFLLTYFSFFFLFLIVLASLIFAPYMLYILFKEKRFGWFTTFFIIISAPGLLLLFDSQYLLIVSLFSLGGSYIYYFILNYVIHDWVREQGSYLDRKKAEKLRQAERDNYIYTGPSN